MSWGGLGGPSGARGNAMGDVIVVEDSPSGAAQHGPGPQREKEGQGTKDTTLFGYRKEVRPG